MEQVLDWLNENELRAFPLLNDASKNFIINGSSWQMPDNFILDLQLVVKTSSLVANGEELVVALNKINKTQQGGIQISFSVGATQFTEFTISSPANKEYPLYIRNPDGNLAVFGEGILSFNNVAAQNTSVTVNLPVEPSVCTQFNGAWLGVNSFRTSPEKISLSPLLAALNRVYEPSLPLENTPAQTILQGDIKFLEGYNFRVDINNGLIDLEIGTSHGLRMNCATSFIPEEYLDCGEIVSYINGIPPDASGNFRLTAGNNINITKGSTISTDFYDSMSSVTQTETSNQHTLFVGLNFQSTDICAPVNLIP